MVCRGIDLNLRLGSLVVRVVVCGAFCLVGGSWVRGCVIEVFVLVVYGLFLKTFHRVIWVCGDFGRCRRFVLNALTGSACGWFILVVRRLFR